MEIIPNWHPVFVHFTLALLIVSVGLYVISALIKPGDLSQQWRTVARWNLWLGAAFTVVTLLTGWYAYNTVTHDDPAHLAMTDHRNWALVTAATFFVLATWSIWQYTKGRTISVFFILALIVGGLLLLSTAWRGGELVYRHGLGVMSLPQPSAAGSDGHDHDHGSFADTTGETETDKIEPAEAENEQPRSADGHDHTH
jgi:uncharacterized membrane protein